jgi:hypothetical protein
MCLEARRKKIMTEKQFFLKSDVLILGHYLHLAREIPQCFALEERTG